MNIFIAAAMRSGSTHIANCIGRLTGARRGDLHPFGAFGHWNEEPMISRDVADTMLRYDGWLFQMHIRAIGGNVPILSEHKIRPIVTVRNIYDSLVSWCDSHDRNLVDGKGPQYTFSPVYIPPQWTAWKQSEKWLWAANNVAPWYCSFYESWRGANIPTLLVKYEDFFSDQQEGIRRIFEWLGHSLPPDANLSHITEKTDGKLWQGRSGEGERKLPANIIRAIKNQVLSWDSLKMEEDLL